MVERRGEPPRLEIAGGAARRETRLLQQGSEQRRRGDGTTSPRR
ncbi:MULTISPECIES: hypothetical protein [Amycolatopsis]|nr:MULTISPECIES: hypothetical protein [Amycolatopsis]